MSAISDIVAQIRTAVYGRDVREAIASGIEQCYADYIGGATPDGTITAAKIDANDITAIQALLGIAGIADARIGQATINTSQINNLTTQMASIADTRIGQATISTAQISNLSTAMASIADAQIGQATINIAQIQNLSTEMAYIADAQISRATIRTAQIQNLSADVATIADARIGQATIGVAQITDLNATVATIADARIGVATINTAQIYNLSAEVANIADARIQNANIDYAQITNMDVGVANIADARIQLADIDYAQIKELNAQSAYFGEVIFEEAVGEKLYVPRLMVGYAQMLAATIGDLVFKASNGNYYHLDVDTETGEVSADQVTVTEEEIESGHTTLGQTIMDTDILATNLSAEDIYAAHILAKRIEAATLDVDELFAREATIAKLNVTDIRNNTYFQLQVGTWNHGTTMSFEINKLMSRVADTRAIIYSATEPSHEGLAVGDIWIDVSESQTWTQAERQTWQDLKNDYTWLDIYGKCKWYTWNGTAFELMYDSSVTIAQYTEIRQTKEMIQLKADRADVDRITGDVTTLKGSFKVMADQIVSEVSRATNNELDIRSTIRQREDSIKLSVVQGTTAAGKVSTLGSYIEIQYDEVKIKSSGKILLESGSLMRLKSGGKFEVKSGGNMHVESGGNLKIESGGYIRVESGGNIKIFAAGGADAITLNQNGIIMETDGIFKLKSQNLIVKSKANEGDYLATQDTHVVSTTVAAEGGGTTTLDTTYYRGVRISDRYMIFYDSTSPNLDNLSDLVKDSAYAGMCIPTNDTSVAFWINAVNGKATAKFKVYGNGNTAIGGTLAVTGSTSVTANLTASGQVQGATLKATGNATIGGTLTVNGTGTSKINNYTITSKGIYYSGKIGIYARDDNEKSSSEIWCANKTVTDPNTGVTSTVYDFKVTGNGDLTAKTINGQSSRDVKHDIRLLEYDSDIIDQLIPVSYIYNDDTRNQTRYGLIYEDTVNLMPVICGVVDEQKVINYIDLVPVLLKEIQGLRHRVAMLEERKAG